LIKQAGHFCFIREIQTTDAQAVLKIRLSEGRDKFLSPVEFDVSKQQQWIEQESKTTSNRNFVICDVKADEVIGTISLYRNPSAPAGKWELGRWVSSGSPLQSLESLMLTVIDAHTIPSLDLIFCSTLSENKQVVNLHNKLPYSEITIGTNATLGLETVVHTLRREDMWRFVTQIEKIISPFKKNDY
jgi:RimJ/RimL family protein N-acetyltransferase